VSLHRRLVGISESRQSTKWLLVGALAVFLSFVEVECKVLFVSACCLLVCLLFCVVLCSGVEMRVVEVEDEAEN